MVPELTCINTGLQSSIYTSYTIQEYCDTIQEYRVTVCVDLVIHQDLDYLPHFSNLEFVCNAMEFDGTDTRLAIANQKNIVDAELSPVLADMGTDALHHAIADARAQILTVACDKNTLSHNGNYTHKIGRLVNRAHEKILRGFSMSYSSHCFTICNYEDRIGAGDTSQVDLIESADTCSICCDQFNDDDEVLVTRCGHVFHVDCSYECIIKTNSVNCPYCRFEDCYLGIWE